MSPFEYPQPHNVRMSKLNPSLALLHPLSHPSIPSQNRKRTLDPLPEFSISEKDTTNQQNFTLNSSPINHQILSNLINFRNPSIAILSTSRANKFMQVIITYCLDYLMKASRVQSILVSRIHSTLQPVTFLT